MLFVMIGCYPSHILIVQSLQESIRGVAYLGLVKWDFKSTPTPCTLDSYVPNELRPYVPNELRPP